MAVSAGIICFRKLNLAILLFMISELLSVPEVEKFELLHHCNRWTAQLSGYYPDDSTYLGGMALILVSVDFN